MIQPPFGLVVRWVFTSLLLTAFSATGAVPLPPEKPLWPGTNWNNPIHYDIAETVQEHTAGRMALSGQNRVYRFVAQPTYSLHEPAANLLRGVGVVICPGGGFRELWLDREGNDLALWLKARGITSLVLKYRTNTETEGGKRKFAAETYLPAVISDARQAIRTLRAHLRRELGQDAKVGICGFSAGGALAMYSVFEPEPETNADPADGRPDFAGLFYPGLRGADAKLVSQPKRIPPIFMINAVDDQTTPVGPCVDFYQTLLRAGAHAELHLYNKGGHGFDMGDGHGESVALWRESFLAWMKDTGLVTAPH